MWVERTFLILLNYLGASVENQLTCVGHGSFWTPYSISLISSSNHMPR